MGQQLNNTPTDNQDRGLVSEQDEQKISNDDAGDSIELLAVFNAIDKLRDDSLSLHLQNNVLAKIRDLAGEQATAYVPLFFGGITTSSYTKPANLLKVSHQFGCTIIEYAMRMQCYSIVKHLFAGDYGLSSFGRYDNNLKVPIGDKQLLRRVFLEGLNHYPGNKAIMDELFDPTLSILDVSEQQEMKSQAAEHLPSLSGALSVSTSSVSVSADSQTPRWTLEELMADSDGDEQADAAPNNKTLYELMADYSDEEEEKEHASVPDVVHETSQDAPVATRPVDLPPVIQSDAEQKNELPEQAPVQILPSESKQLTTSNDFNYDDPEELSKKYEKLDRSKIKHAKNNNDITLLLEDKKQQNAAINALAYLFKFKNIKATRYIWSSKSGEESALLDLARCIKEDFLCDAAQKEKHLLTFMQLAKNTSAVEKKMPTTMKNILETNKYAVCAALIKIEKDKKDTVNQFKKEFKVDEKILNDYLQNSTSTSSSVVKCEAPSITPSIPSSTHFITAIIADEATPCVPDAPVLEDAVKVAPPPAPPFEPLPILPKLSTTHLGKIANARTAERPKDSKNTNELLDQIRKGVVLRPTPKPEIGEANPRETMHRLILASKFNLKPIPEKESKKQETGVGCITANNLQKIRQAVAPVESDNEASDNEFSEGQRRNCRK